MPSVCAFCLREPSDLFMSFTILATGVLAFECCFNSLTSAAVYGLRPRFFLALTTSYSLNRGGWIAYSIGLTEEGCGSAGRRSRNLAGLRWLANSHVALGDGPLVYLSGVELLVPSPDDVVHR